MAEEKKSELDAMSGIFPRANRALREFDLKDVDFTGVAPFLFQEGLGLTHDFWHVRLHSAELETIGHVGHLLLTNLRRRIVDDVVAENGLHEAVNFRLRELFISRGKKSFGDVGPDQESEILAHHAHRVARPVLMVAIENEPTLIFSKFNKVSKNLPQFKVSGVSTSGA